MIDTSKKHSRFGYLFEKEKDKDWFKDVFDNLIPFSNITNKDVVKMLAVYGIINNDISYLKPYLAALDDPTEGYFKDTMLPDRLNELPVVYNRLFSKFQYHLGQILNQKIEFDVVPLSDAANEFKEQEFDAVIQEFVDRAISDLTNKINLQEANQTSQVEQSIEEPPLKDNFVSTLEQFFSNIVEYFFYKFPIRQLWTLSGTHLLCADTVQIGIVEDCGVPKPIVYNVIRTGFQKSPDKINIQEGAYFYENSPILIHDAYAEVLAYGTPEDLERLETYTASGYNRPNPKWDVTKPGAETQLDYTAVRYGIESSPYALDKNIGNSTIDTQNRNEETTNIWRTYLQFLAFEEIIYLTHFNEFGKEVTEQVSSNYPIPKESRLVKDTDKYGKPITRFEWIDEFSQPISAEKVYIRKRYEGVRYGGDIFIKCREVPFQVEKEDIGLSIKGRVFSSVNSKSISIVERGIPSLLQYIYLKKLQNREFSKYKGTLQVVDASQVPDYLTMKDDEGKIIEGVDKIMILDYIERVTGKSFFDSTYNESGLRNPNQPTASSFMQSSAIGELVNIQNLLDLVDREMGLQMLVPPQAEGQYQPYSTNKDNNQALSQAYTMAQTLYDGHTDVWKAAVEEYINQFTCYYREYFKDNPEKKEVNLNYIVKNGTQKVLKIIPEYLDHQDIGIFVRDSQQNEEYRRLMENLGLQALAQNRGEGVEVISTIMKSIVRNESPETIHFKIMEAGKKQQERAIAMQQSMAQQQSQASNLLLQKQQLVNSGAVEKATVEGNYDLENTKLKLTGEGDTDGIPQDVEVSSKLRDQDRKDRELALKEMQIVNNNTGKKT